MRTAITIGISHDGEAEFLTGPDVPNAEQREVLRNAPAENERFARVEVWESDRGITRSRKFAKPPVSSEPSPPPPPPGNNLAPANDGAVDQDECETPEDDTTPEPEASAADSSSEPEKPAKRKRK